MVDRRSRIDRNIAVRYTSGNHGLSERVGKRWSLWRLEMGRICVLSILFSLAFAAYGQQPATDCPDVKLVAPDHSYPWSSIRISAEDLKSPIKGDWMVVKL